jgi:hypothetical protein
MEQFEAGLIYQRLSGYSARSAKHELKFVEVDKLEGGRYVPGYTMNVSYLAQALEMGMVVSTKHVNHGLWTTVRTGGGCNTSLRLLRLDCVALAPGEIE